MRPSFERWARGTWIALLTLLAACGQSSIPPFLGESGHGGAGASAGSSGVAGASGVGGAPNYDGKWVGTTSSGLLFETHVFASAVLDTMFDWSIQAPGPSGSTCTATGEIATTFGTPLPLDAGGFMKGPISGNPIVYTVSGTFTSATRANGSLLVTHTPADCAATAMLTWNAEKVVCGNGRVEWPETCDSATALASGACSQVCQLPPTGEQEPNNTVAQATAAMAPFTDDAVLAGSLASPSDIDMFAIRNPLAGILGVTVETHGQTVGVCGGADTLVEIFDSSGKLLTQNDNGGRALFCSLVQYQLASGETAFVAVSSNDGRPIPGYNLVIAFQHI